MSETKQSSLEDLIKRMLAGENLALGRLINIVENGGYESQQIMKEVHSHTGRAYRIGITGPPGIGKSTLVDKLTGHIRGLKQTVGVIAVDPTSPFSGGAILGDRVRMQQHYLDKGVFIRSMATRGNLGGLPKTAAEVCNLIDASGKDCVIIETVGVGQTELDVVKNVDTVLVVLSPGYGDNIQTMKAGLMEIADVFVVNKADQPGANELIVDIRNMLQLKQENNGWQIPVVATQAVNNIGISELYDQVQHHRKVLEDTGLYNEKRKSQRWNHFLQIVEQKVASELVKLVEKDEELVRYSGEVREGQLDPYSAAEMVLASGTLAEHLSRCFLPE